MHAFHFSLFTFAFCLLVRRVGSPEGGSPTGGGLSGSRTGAAGCGCESGGSGKGSGCEGSGTIGSSGVVGGRSLPSGCGNGSPGCGVSALRLLLIYEVSSRLRSSRFWIAD